MESELRQCWRMSFTGKFEDQGGTTSSESRAVLLGVVEQSRDVLTLPCQEPRSFHGNILSSTSLWAERTRRCGGDLETAGSAWVETSHTPLLAVGMRCPQSPCKHQSSDSGSKQPPRGAADGPGRKVLSQSPWLWAASKGEGILPLSKVKACLQKNLSQILMNRISHFSSPSILLHLLVTRSLQISKCLMKKGNLLFSILCVICQLVTLYCEHLIYVVTVWSTRWKIGNSLRIVHFRYKRSCIPW